MKKEMQLPEDIVNQLIKLPESGMGFQVVDFMLKDGTILKNMTVLNSSVVLIEENIKNLINDIVSVKLSKNNV